MMRRRFSVLRAQTQLRCRKGGRADISSSFAPVRENDLDLLELKKPLVEVFTELRGTSGPNLLRMSPK